MALKQKTTNSVPFETFRPEIYRCLLCRTLYSKIVAVCKKNKLSHFVINLKWMVGGQVNPIISIITDNNNNENDNSNNNNNNNILNFSSGGRETCSHQLRPSGLKIFVGK